MELPSSNAKNFFEEAKIKAYLSGRSAGIMAAMDVPGVIQSALDSPDLDDKLLGTLTALSEKPEGQMIKMFAPMMGIAEDEATGAAAVRLTAELGRGLNIVQGAGSELWTTVDEDGWVELGGRSVDDDSITV